MKLQPSPVLACKMETITLPLASLFPFLNILLPSLPLSPLPFPSPSFTPFSSFLFFYPLPLSASSFSPFLLPFLLSFTLRRVSYIVRLVSNAASYPGFWRDYMTGC